MCPFCRTRGSLGDQALLAHLAGNHPLASSLFMVTLAVGQVAFVRRPRQTATVDLLLLALALAERLSRRHR